MRTKTCSDEQIAKVLEEERNGRDKYSIILELGISERTFYRWKSKYGKKGAVDIKKTRSLEEENRRLKKLIGDLTLSVSILEDELSKAYDKIREYNRRNDDVHITPSHQELIAKPKEI
jgi:putative transposase